jgi:hypothetical protein
MLSHVVMTRTSSSLPLPADAQFLDAEEIPDTSNYESGVEGSNPSGARQGWPLALQ